MSAYTAVEPFFAPLSKPMIEQALSSQEASHFPISLNMQHIVSAFTSQYATLRERMLQPRNDTFTQMQTAIRKNAFTTEWMLDALSKYSPKKNPEKTRPLSAESLSKWRDVGLVHYQERNIPDFDNGAALITLRRLIPNKERRWLPSPPKNAQKTHYFAQEPLWWCWRQDSPTSPILSCPVPLPQDIPASALLWTDWLGASWSAHWLRIGEMGCCRWAGTTYVNDTDTIIWNMTQSDLERWDVPIGKSYQAALLATPLTLHTLATSALLLVATQRLEEIKMSHLASLLSHLAV